MKSFEQHKDQRDKEPEAYHEGGHGAIARALDPNIVVTAVLQRPGEGESKVVFPPGTPETTKYAVSVAGCLAEGKKMSKLAIDPDPKRMHQFAVELCNQLRTREPKFYVQVPLVGDRHYHAGCNPKDFDWLKGREADFGEVTKASVEVGKMLNQPKIDTEVEVVAEILIRLGDYDSRRDS